MERLSGIDLQTYESLYEQQGARITFKCDKVTYQGIIDVILPDICSVKLRHAKIVEGDHYLGNLRFKFSELSSFAVIESSESVNRYPRNDYLLNILKNNRPVPNSTIAKALYGDKFSADDSTDETKDEEEFSLDLPRHLEQRLPKDYSQINTIENDFYKAIQCICNEKVIGVSFHGLKISRFGKFSWLCISTDICTYLFDIQKLGKEAFDKGLKDILESKSIKKVIHDSRYSSDCLAHQYSTLLNNVFDTRVADFVISMQRYNEKYKFHSFGSLDHCLRIYLKVPQEFLFEREMCQESFFSKRPISNAYLYDLLKSAIYLKLLKDKLSKELLIPFYRAVGFYRTILAKSSQDLIDTLGSSLSKPDEIPQCLLMNGLQTVYFLKPKAFECLPLRCTFIHPKTGEIIKPYTGTPDAVKKVSLEKKISNKKVQKKCYVTSNDLLCNSVRKIGCNANESYTDKLDNEGLSAKPSFRHIDEVYHKLVNRMYPGQSEKSVNIKPSINYASKFADKHCISSSSCLNSSIDSCTDVSKRDSSQLNKISDECDDVWLKLRAEVIAEKANSSLVEYGKRKITFVPG